MKKVEMNELRNVQAGMKLLRFGGRFEAEDFGVLDHFFGITFNDKNFLGIFIDEGRLGFGFAYSFGYGDNWYAMMHLFKFGNDSNQGN